MIITVIPCKVGSRSIPKKNLQRVGGQTLLERTIAVAKALNYPTVVSTDSDEVAAISRAAGIEVVFAHPPKYHGPNSRAVDVWAHAWERAERLFHVDYFEFSVYLEPTSPCRTPEMVENTLELLTRGDYDLTMTVEPVPPKYLAARQWYLWEDTIEPYVTGQVEKPRQQMTQSYIRNGAAYAARRGCVVGGGSLYLGTLIGHVVTEPLVNIDEPADLQEAETWLSSESTPA